MSHTGHSVDCHGTCLKFRVPNFRSPLDKNASYKLCPPDAEEFWLVLLPPYKTSSGLSPRTVQSGEPVQERVTGHLSPHSPIFFISFDHRKVDPIVDVDLLYPYSQSRGVSADVADRELKITDHMSLREVGRLQSMRVIDSDNQGKAVCGDQPPMWEAGQALCIFL